MHLSIVALRRVHLTQAPSTVARCSRAFPRSPSAFDDNLLALQALTETRHALDSATIHHPATLPGGVGEPIVLGSIPNATARLQADFISTSVPAESPKVVLRRRR